MSSPRIYVNSNPSQMYLEALYELVVAGEEYAPRGKRVKELRPVLLAYTNPLNRVTNLKGRVINPFFQLAESFWILAGRSDVAWLTNYNQSIAQFSDDGVFFNAPYGERLRSWGKNDARQYIYCPIDQLRDCYLKLLEDQHTRQAVAFIGDPRFDNYEYTNVRKGKDIACNLNIKFKVRNGKLDISVDNRSNDLHWGVFGANLAQFATIQECVAAWLGVEVGTYYQVTDSLHIYLDDYGAGETDKVLSAYGIQDVAELAQNGEIIHLPTVKHFSFPDEPRMSANFEQFQHLVQFYHINIDPVLHSDMPYKSNEAWNMLVEFINSCPDEYWKMAFTAMLAYQCHKRDLFEPMLNCLTAMKDSQWKIACLRFLSKKYSDRLEFRLLYSNYDDDVRAYINREDITL